MRSDSSERARAVASAQLAPACGLDDGHISFVDPPAHQRVGPTAESSVCGPVASSSARSEPSRELVDSADAPAAIAAAALLPSQIEASLLAILDAPLEAHESAHVGFARKEREMGELFATLSARASQMLHGRLAAGAPGDQVATKFARLTAERRIRLLQFLSLAARREALAKAGHRAR